MVPHETITGRILYTSRKPDRLGAERGREYFTITKHRDGRRSLRAHCQIDDAPNVMRDVTLTLDKQWITRNAHVMLSVGDAAMGSTWYRFMDTYAECEGWTSERGRFTDRVDYDRPRDLFGAHPIQGDAWHLHSVDRSHGPTIKVFDRFLMSSSDHRGATGPELIWHDAGMRVEYVGEERITVAAGTFDAFHFCYGERGSTAPGSNETGEHPPYEVWTTADGDFILLKAHVTGYMMTHYELTELNRLPADEGGSVNGR
ncbi:MAG: hypothetical protein AAGC71_02395 [Pseudomonadota bacterium]